MNDTLILNAAKAKVLGMKFPNGDPIITEEDVVLPEQHPYQPHVENDDYYFIEIGYAETDNWAYTDQTHKFRGTIVYVVNTPISRGTDQVDHLAEIINNGFTIVRGSDSYLKLSNGHVVRVMERRKNPSDDDDNYYRVSVQVTIEGIDSEWSSGGDVGTNDHSQLINRSAPNQHPIPAITGLEGALGGKVNAEPGKGLSTNDYSSTDKENVNKVPEIAQEVENLDALVRQISQHRDIVDLNAEEGIITDDTFDEFVQSVVEKTYPANTLLMGTVSCSGLPAGLTEAKMFVEVYAENVYSFRTVSISDPARQWIWGYTAATTGG